MRAPCVGGGGVTDSLVTDHCQGGGVCAQDLERHHACVRAAGLARCVMRPAVVAIHCSRARNTLDVPCAGCAYVDSVLQGTVAPAVLFTVQ